MQEVSSLQRPANEIAHSGNTIVNSYDVEHQNIMKVDEDMSSVNDHWNTLNFKVIERENRCVDDDDANDDDDDKF
jgi:hypothetical protein